MTTFAELDLIEPLQRAVAAQNYTRPTPIQERAIPPLLDGRDVLGCAQTGTGKTAAFALPVLQHLAESPPRQGHRPIRALVLSPTRELAAQIGDSFEAYAEFLKIYHVTIFGGVNQRPQVNALRRGVDILVATPGRLLDLIGQGFVDLSEVEFFVLDEADRMLDMGFIHDIRKVLKLLPADRQNLLFSATMPKSIVQLASSFLDEPIRVEVAPQSTTAERVEQRVMFTEKRDKKRLLVDLLVDAEEGVERAIVFTRTKHGANRLVKQLDRAGITAAAIHGNKSQNARKRALNGFREGDVPILVATDIAARGIDVEEVTHVFNYDLPNEPETYVHRIGRTARAGREGIAISFCDESETSYLTSIERLTGEPIERIVDHEYHFETAVPSANKGGGGGGGSRGSGSKRSGPSNGSGRNNSGQKRRRRRRRGGGGGGGNNNGQRQQASSNSSGGGQRSSGGNQSGGGPSNAQKSYRRRRRRSGGGGNSGGGNSGGGSN